MSSKKQLLIKLVRDKGRFWDALAVDTALNAARNPNKPELLTEAFRITSTADYCNKMAEDIVSIIEELWPVDKLEGEK